MPTGVGTALLIGGLASAGASAVGGKIQSNAAKKAAALQIASQDKAQGFNQQVYADQQKLLNPYVQAGNDSLSRLMAQHWGSGGMSPGMRGTASSYGMQETPNSQYAPPPPGSRAPGMGSNIPPNVAAPRFGAQPNPLAAAMGGAPQGGPMVKLQGPDGSTRDVPAQLADQFIQRGARRVG